MKTKTINLLLILTTIFSIPAYANCPKTDTIVVESSGIFSGTDELGNKWKSPDPRDRRIEICY
ncbi:MAG: hypothetical protein K0R49_1050 [Burkholderiales bacterium]|nr:hypothetical protein [Burkholderiales bacterium]